MTTELRNSRPDPQRSSPSAGAAITLGSAEAAIPLRTVRAATTARRYLASRRRRAEMMTFEFFADPAWDMLLDLFAAQAEGRRISVSSACIASGVATSTALRWITELEHHGLVVRRRDPTDGRRTFLEIPAGTVEAIERWIEATFAR